MKIIQSFAKFEEGSPYSRNKKIYLNFYSFLLSYLTLNKYYGHVTMFCNQSAYDAFIKYIPYDDIIIKENNNKIEYWNVYKIDAMKSINDDFIHVDSDVFIFKDVFFDFINENYDAIVQDITPANRNPLSNNYVKDNAEFLIKNNILTNIDSFDDRFSSCGTIGMKKNVCQLYFDAFDKTYEAMKSNKLKNIPRNKHSHHTAILEELTFHLVAIENNFKVFEILPSDLIGESDKGVVSDMKGYTHMWFDSKFNEQNIDLMKRKIRTDFPRHGFRINNFEADLIKQGIL